MKNIIVVIIAALTGYAFALTETIDGITWKYYIENDHAVLEYPGLRKSSFAQPAYTGTLPSEVSIPSSLGGYPVSIIGQLSLWLGHSNRVPYVGLVVIPETVTEIGDMAFIGSFLHNPSYQYRYYGWAHVGYLQPAPNILFLGSPPTTANLSKSWLYKKGANVSDDQWVNNDFGTYYQNAQQTGEYAFYQKRQFYGCNCYVIEGVEGWIEGSDYFNGVVKYGAAKVEIAPIEKVFAGAASVYLSCTNRTAKIYYTLDGSDPTTNQTANCFLYEGPFAISQRTQVKTLAYVAEYPYQVVYSNEYALGQTVVPSILADENVFNWSGNMITLSCDTEGAEIRFSLDGSEPTEESALYTGAFAIDDTTTVKAKAYKTDWFESETATATFTRQWYTVDMPDITPDDTIFANASQEVSISCGTEDAIILYTTDGSDPATNGREYKRPFKVYNTCTVRAVAVKYDWKNSEEATATMTRGEPLSAAANLYGYKMGTDAEKPWVVDTTVSHDGVSSIRSNGDGSYVQTSVNGKGTLSFWWKAMCEEPGYEWYDHGAFVTGGDTITRIAGEDTGWVYYSMTFSTLGKHVLRWEYHKDEEGDFYPDCVWLDQVQWVPADGSGTTLTSPEPVPYSWLSRYGLGVASGDFEAAANAASGKMNCGRPTTVWEEFVAGLDPTNENSRFEAKIEMVDGAPVVKWEPDLNTNGIVRIYKVYGRESLAEGEWQYPTNSLHRFFRVDVDMP